MASNKSDSIDSQEIISDTRKNISEWFQHFSDNLQLADTCTDFLFGNQWDGAERDAYQRLHRPCLQFNKLYAYYKQIIGEQRQNTPNLSLRAKNKTVDQKTVDIAEGLVRNIAYSSRNNIVYQTAFENSVGRGFGAIEIEVDYEDANSFNQIIKVNAIEDARRAFFDPNATSPSKDDGEFAGVYKRMGKETFQKRYPEIPYPQSFTDEYGFDWCNTKTVLIADIYKKEWFKKIIVELSDGKILDLKDVDKYLKEDYRGINPKPKEVKRRETDDYKIKYYKMIHNEILEEKECPGKYLRIIYVDGDSYYWEGKQRIKPFILYAMDAQRFYNFLVSHVAFQVKAGHCGRYRIDPKGITDETRKYFLNPERAAALPFSPQQSTYDPPTDVAPTMINLVNNADLTFESILGRYGTVRGADSAEQSGIAIAHKIRQGNTSTFSYPDNLNRAVEQVGRIILDLLPDVYDNQRDVIITSRDGDQKTVTINKKTVLGDKENPILDIKYEIEVSAGSSFAMQKQENLETLVKLGSANPQYMALLGDLIAENLDLPNTNQIVDRLKTTVPPNILASEEGKPPPPPKPNPAEMLAQTKIKTEMMQAQADQTKAQAQMVDAQRRAHETEINHGVATVRADAEVKKAALDYHSNLMKTYLDGLQEENKELKRQLANLGPHSNI